MIEVEGQEHHVFIDAANPSIEIDESLCKKCKLCIKTCSAMMEVHDHYDIEKAGRKPICINCAQCVQVCPFGAIKYKSSVKQVKQALIDKSKIVVFNTAPAVRVCIGDAFGIPSGTFIQGRMVSAIRELGAKYVLDVVFGADLTIMEEAHELVERIQNGGVLPMFTSCCPAWVKKVEIFHPELIPHMSTVKSPIAMQGTMLKTYFANVHDINPHKICNVTVAPCAAKKAERTRKGLNASGCEHDVDITITTTGLAKLIKDKEIDFNILPDDEFDSVFSTGSSSGMIFGNAGGVMQAAIRTAYYFLNGENMTEEQIKLCDPIRGIDNLRVAEIDMKKLKLRVAAVSRISEAEKLIAKIQSGEEHFDFVEVMACEGGCVAGGGQPRVPKPQRAAVISNRTQNLYKQDTERARVRFCHENPDIIRIYKEFLGEPGSPIAHKLLHRTYRDKSYRLDREAHPEHANDD